LSLALGVFFVFDGIDKRTWLLDSSSFANLLRDWLNDATPAARWYIATFALPAVPLFARLIVLGELFVGVALACAFWTRVSAALALFVLLNYQFSSGEFFRTTFLTDGRGLPLIGGLLALVLSGRKLPWSLGD
jgi:uncharacterized membrane protein YphA (DoxX/SURF4 family)